MVTPGALAPSSSASGARSPRSPRGGKRGFGTPIRACLRDLHTDGRAGKTISNYAEALAAFCDWCLERHYLTSDPLKKFKDYDTTPQKTRRAMAVDEIHQLLAVSPNHRKLLWETAILSGLRANELRHLSVDHIGAGGLQLESRWTKNRKQEFLPLPHALLERLHNNVAEALAWYDRTYKGTPPSFIPTSPLLYVPRDLAPTLDKDLRKAGISKHTKAGKLDFHALRVTYITLIIESGANPKETQTLARHATAEMTMNIYGRAREERLSFAVERVANVISLSSAPDESIQGTENSGSSAPVGGGSNPPFGINPAAHEHDTDNTQTPQKPTLVGLSSSSSAHQPLTSAHRHDIFVHEKYVICVSYLPDDLQTVIDAWDNFPDAVRGEFWPW